MTRVIVGQPPRGNAMTVTREIKEYLHGRKFRDALVRRYSRFEILSEAALRTMAANLLTAKLRALGGPAKGYRVTCETHLAEGGVIPDILIWRNKHPRIWIELKATRIFDSTKARADWEKLQNHCKRYPSVKAGYLIYVARLNRGGIGVSRDNQTRRYWPIAIALSDHISDMTSWYAEYKRRAHYKLPARKEPGASFKPAKIMSYVSDFTDSLMMGLPLVSLRQLASSLYMSTRRVQQLVAEGMPKAARGRYDLVACLEWYVSYLQRAVERRESLTGKTTAEKVRVARVELLKAQTDKIGRENAEAQGQLIPLETYRAHMADMIVTARQRLLQMPGPRCPSA